MSDLPGWMDQADVVLTLRVMTEDEATAWGIPLDKRHNYVCLEKHKGLDPGGHPPGHVPGHDPGHPPGHPGAS